MIGPSPIRQHYMAHLTDGRAVPISGTDEAEVRERARELGWTVESVEPYEPPPPKSLAEKMREAAGVAGMTTVGASLERTHLTVIEGGAEAEEPVCRACLGFGSVRRDVPVTDPDFGKAYPCQACADSRHNRRVARLIEAAGIQEYAGCDYGGFVALGGDRAAYEVAHKWRKQLAESDRLGFFLYLWGRLGRGKSWIASDLVRTRIQETGEAARFVDLIALFDDVKAGFDDPEKRREDLVADVIACPFVVIDDIGAELATRWVVQETLRIVAGRIRAHRPTVFTSNYSIEQLEKRMVGNLGEDGLNGARMVDRLKEHADHGRWVIEVGGKNLRDGGRA